MKRLMLVAAVAGFGLAVQSPAEALSLAPVGHSESSVTLVEGGCGPGGHRNEFGRCRPNFAPRFYGRACPPRMFLDRFGRCRF